MRSLLPLPAARASRRGLGALAVSLLTLATGCSWITGVPEVDRVEVSVNPPEVAVGLNAQATGTAFGNKGNVIQNSRVTIGYKSSDPSIATVNPTTGLIIPIKEGTVVITATARNKSGSDTLMVTPAIPAAVELTNVNLTVGATVPFTIVLRNAAGQVLQGRPATITSSNPTVVRVAGNGRTDGTTLQGIAVGNATIVVDVGGRVATLGVTVFPQLPARATLTLPNAASSLIEGQTAQAVLSLFAADGSTIPLTGQSYVCNSDDPTVASVQASTCLVQAVRTGTTTIRAVVGGSVPAQLSVTVVSIPAREVRFTNRNQFVRLDSKGVGVVTLRTAVAFDSLGRQIANRPIAYRSTDPTVFSVSPSTGTVTAQKLGSARLIASADNGAVADTLSLTVTPVPIVAVIVRPQQQTLFPGETQQFTATLTDSLGATVTGRTITWFSSAPTVLQVNGTTGLGTALASGTATVNAQVEAIPGLPGTAPMQGASVLVLPTPVASIDVQPTPIAVTVGRSTQISVTLKDAGGATIFTQRQVVATPADPTIASVAAPNGTGPGAVTGLKAGTTTITFQALDLSGNPQGAATTVTVNVAAP